MSTPKLTPAAETRCAPDDCYHAPTGICAPGHCQRQSAKPRRIDDHMTRARRLVEDHISAYGMVPHPDRIKEVIAEQSQQSFDLGFRAAGGIVEPPSPAGTSAAKTNMRSECGNSNVSLIHAATSSDQHTAMPSSNSPNAHATELPDSVRIPLDSLWADSGYLIGRVIADSSCGPMVVKTMRERLNQIKTAWHSQAGKAVEGLTKSEGHAASLRQQAQWVREAQDGAVPPSQRIDIGDVDADELDDAAAEIERLSAQVERVAACVKKQAEDEGCWFKAQTVTEAYLQRQLRLLHAAFEGTDFFGFPLDPSSSASSTERK